MLKNNVLRKVKELWVGLFLLGLVAGAVIRPYAITAYGKTVAWRNSYSDPRYTAVDAIESELPFRVIDISYIDDDSVVFVVTPTSAMDEYDEAHKSFGRDASLSHLCSMIGVLSRDVLERPKVTIAFSFIVSARGFEVTAYYASTSMVFVADAEFLAVWCAEHSIIDDIGEFRDHAKIHFPMGASEWSWNETLPRHWFMESLPKGKTKGG